MECSCMYIHIYTFIYRYIYIYRRGREELISVCRASISQIQHTYLHVQELLHDMHVYMYIVYEPHNVLSSTYMYIKLRRAIIYSDRDIYLYT